MVLTCLLRFGEDDDTLLLEEKMWARMQKERNQRSRRVGMFNLGDDNGAREVLTHRGQALGDNDEYGGGRQDDEDDDLDAEVVDQLHFGGDGGGDSRLTHPQVGAVEIWCVCLGISCGCCASILTNTYSSEST